MEPVLADDTIDDTCAVLTMVARFHGRSIEPSKVDAMLRRLGAEPYQRDAANLVDGAAELGLRARGLELDRAADIAALTFPCVAHLLASGERDPDSFGGAGYFVLLERIYLQHAELSVIDPYSSRDREPVTHLFSRGSGVFITFEPGHKIPRAILRVRR